MQQPERRAIVGPFIEHAGPITRFLLGTENALPSEQPHMGGMREYLECNRSRIVRPNVERFDNAVGLQCIENPACSATVGKPDEIRRVRRSMMDPEDGGKLAFAGPHAGGIADDRRHVDADDAAITELSARPSQQRRIVAQIGPNVDKPSGCVQGGGTRRIALGPSQVKADEARPGQHRLAAWGKRRRGCESRGMSGEQRLGIRKMYKLFIGGAFVRSESARSDVVEGENVARASRKDGRDAVVAARSAFERWRSQAPALRGLVLYRLAEMLEARAAELAASLVRGGTCDAQAARREVHAAIDRTVWYAGWCDKYLALASSHNPVAGPYLSVSTAEPAGVVAASAPDRPALLGLVTTVIPPLVSGNAVVAFASERDPRTAIVFAECVATSDLPAGACNILTGVRADVLPMLAGHMDVNSFAAAGLPGDDERALTELAAENVKRTRFEAASDGAEWFAEQYDDLARVLAFTEIKTTWQPNRI